jgi:hypothetical protein
MDPVDEALISLLQQTIRFIQHKKSTLPKIKTENIIFNFIEKTFQMHIRMNKSSKSISRLPE